MAMKLDTGGIGGPGGTIINNVTPRTITTAPVEVTANEEATITGNIFANSTTTVGSLFVFLFTVSGQSGLHLPGEIVTITGRGRITLNSDGSYSFVPFSNVNGTVPSIIAQCSNGRELQVCTLDISVNAVNDAPVANDDSWITQVDTAITIAVLNNDVDADGNILTITHINGGSAVVGNNVSVTNGTVVLNSNKTLTVTPAADYEGPISFTYTVSDGTSSSTADVTIQVGVDNVSMFSPPAPILTGNALDEAAYNFGLTYMGRYGNTWNNGVNVSVPPYSANQGLFDLENREPWLYDRATTVYCLYLRTRDPSILEEAFALADLYMANVTVTGGLGRFTIVGGNTGADTTDIKYLYPIIGVWYEREKTALGLPNPTIHRSKCEAMYRQSLLSHTKTYVSGPVLWTERNHSYAIQNCLAWYWLSGDETALDDATDYFENLLTMSAASGAPLHPHSQHEGSAIATPITSPWMSSFLVEAVVQYFRTTGDERAVEWIANYGDFIYSRAFYVSEGVEFAELEDLRLPAYLVGESISYPEGDLLDMEHAYDVASLIKKVIWAKEYLEEDTTDFVTLKDELEEAAVIVFNYWTRTTEGYPRYRVTPPRKYGWWFRNDYSDIIYTGVVPVAPINVTAVSIGGSTQQGSVLSVAPGSWNGQPAPTLTYQWRRNGVAISGQTGLSYTTQVADEGATITVAETGTNTGGTATVVSNGIVVVGAGAPEITAQPSNQQKSVGQTATFSVTATGTPSPSYQWQVNTGSGWSNVSTGTGGTTSSYTTATLAEDDDGNQYRVQVSNSQGSVTSSAASLAMIIQQDAVRFAGDGAGAIITYALGGAGHVNITLSAKVYLEARAATAQIMGVGHLTNLRRIGIQHDNVFQSYLPSLGDSQTGVTGGGWGANPPPLNTWLDMTWRASNTPGGAVYGDWAVATGTDNTFYQATRNNGIDTTLPAGRVFLNGGGIGNGIEGGVRFQYVRGRTGMLTDEQVQANRTSTDTTGWEFWLVFEDNGSGGVTVRDATGNNRVPTMVSGTLAVGPVIASMP